MCLVIGMWFRRRKLFPNSLLPSRIKSFRPICRIWTTICIGGSVSSRNGLSGGMLRIGSVFPSGVLF
jgi:hypothetical protein